MSESGHPPINHSRYREMALACLMQGGFLDAPNFDSAHRLLSSHENENMVCEAVRVRGLGSGFEFNERKELETFLRAVGMLISLERPVGDAIGTASTLINLRQSNGAVHARPSEGIIDHEIDNAAQCGYVVDDGSREMLDMFADINGFQAVVFTPSSSPSVDGREALLGANFRNVSLEADVRDGGLYSGVVMVRATFGDWGAICSRGTGIVIDDRHIMTVAHNVWDKRYGPANAITIYRDTRVDPNGVNCYHVEVASVHCGWVHSHSTANDFALLRIAEQLSDRMKPMAYRKTPIAECPITTTIYGFASDLPELRGESIQLVQSQGRAEYDAAEKMVCHNGDTMNGMYGGGGCEAARYSRRVLFADPIARIGASGGPVVDENGVVIAIHWGCGRGSSVDRINKAVTINHHNNNVEGFILALGAHQSSNDLSGVVPGPGIIFRTCQVTLFAWG